MTPYFKEKWELAERGIGFLVLDEFRLKMASTSEKNPLLVIDYFSKGARKRKNLCP